MKKLLLLSAVIFTTFLLAQHSKFTGNYSTKSLKEIQKTVPQNEKHEFYKQYFKAKVFEEMKDTFNYKSYSDLVLRKFTDSIFAFYDGEEVINNDNQKFVASRTWDQHLQFYKENMAKDPEESRRYIANALYKNKKERAKFLEQQKKLHGDSAKKEEKTTEELKKEYEELVAAEKELFENDPSSSIGLKKTIARLDELFDKQDVSDDFNALMKTNLNSKLDTHFTFLPFLVKLENHQYMRQFPEIF